MDITISADGPGGRCTLQRYPALARIRATTQVRWALGVAVFAVGTLCGALIAAQIPWPQRPHTAADDLARDLLLPVMLGISLVALLQLVLEPVLQRRLAPQPVELRWREGVLEVDGQRLELAALNWSLDQEPELRDDRAVLRLEGVVLEHEERVLLEQALTAARADARARFADRRVPDELRRLLE